MDTEPFLARLSQIQGIREWTAQYVAMCALGEADAIPFGDLGVLRALALESQQELERRAEAWQPL